MAAQTGRTTNKWVDFRVSDAAGTIRSIPINRISILGITYEAQDMTAFQDAVKGALPGMPSAPIEISGPLDTSAAGTAPALSGSYTVLKGINGGTTPLSLGVFFGIRHVWESGEPVFGIAKSTTNGYLCFSFTVDPSTMTYTARFDLYSGSALPTWDTAAIT